MLPGMLNQTGRGGRDKLFVNGDLKTGFHRCSRFRQLQQATSVSLTHPKDAGKVEQLHATAACGDL